MMASQDSCQNMPRMLGSEDDLNGSYVIALSLG